MSIKKINTHGLTLIKKFEGCKLKAYKDSAGVWTIGYGHTGDVFAGQTITQEEADDLLRFDVREAEHYLNNEQIILNQNQYDALVSFIYNVGYGNFRRSTLRKKVLRNPIDKSIRTEFMRWVYAGGRRLEGLKRRRKAEADLYFTISYITKYKR